MSEDEWLACRDVLRLCRHWRGVASPRKLRLFACAACRRIAHAMPDVRSREAIAVSERYADGLATSEELQRAAADAEQVADLAERNQTRGWNAARTAALAAGKPGTAAERVACTAADVDLLRDLAGNPFRPLALDRNWLTWQEGTVVKLAQAIYEQRAFDRLPILGDALEDAGCAQEILLAHCRGSGPHVRGCWTVDLLLARS